MVSVVSKELHFDEELKKKIEFIYDFCNTKLTFINGSIHKVTKRIWLSHKMIIKGITFLAFNYSNEIYIKNLSQKIEWNANRLLSKLNYVVHTDARKNILFQN